MQRRFLFLLALILCLLISISDSDGAEFYRKQSGSTTITGLSTTVTIDYVCPDQSFLVFTTTVDNNEPRDCHVGGEITNETTLTFEKETGGGSTVEIRWQVFEFSSGVNVQHGSNNVNGTQIIPITPVDPTKSFVIFSGKKDGVTFGTDDFVEASIVNAGADLRLRVSGGQHTEAFWQVVEFDSAFVQLIGTSLPAGQDSITSTIATPVDKNKTLLINSHRVGGNVNSDDLPRVEFTDSASLSFIREGTTRTIDLRTFVIEFSDGTTVQHGKDTFATGEVTKDVTVSEISSSTGVLGTGHQLKQGSTTFNSDDNTGHNWFTYEFTSNTSLRISRDVGTGSSAIAPYQIVTFNDPSNTTFYTRASGDWDDNNTWSYASDGSSGAVPTGVWPSRNDNVVIRNGHTVTVNSTTDNQLCALSPDDLNRSNVGTFTSSGTNMFYHTGDIIVDNGGTFNITIRSMYEGFTYVNGSFTSNADVVNLGNLEVTSSGSFNTNDDLILSGNSLTIIDNFTTSSDDIYIDHTDALLCGSDTINIGNGAPDPTIQYLNGATSSQICGSLTITCTSNCGGFTPPSPAGNFSLGYLGLGGVGDSINNKLWLKADDLNQADGSSVTSWPDTSGNGLLAQANLPLLAVNQPTFNSNAVNGVLPSIGFDGGDLLNLGNSDLDFIPQTDAWSFFIAYNVNVGNSGTFLSKARNASGSRQYHYFTNANQLDGIAGGSSNNGSSTSATGAWTIASTFIEANASGFNSYLNSTSEISNGGVGTATLATTDVLIGARRINPSTSTFAQNLTGEIAEIGMYSQSVNEAQRIIIENYLSAKYDNSLTSNDLYDEDNNANGDYDFEVAGIGQASDGSFQKDSKGQGLVRMSLPKDIDNNEYLIWGHDGTVISEVNFTDVDGTTIEARLNRVWRISEADNTGTAVDIGTVRLTFDVSDLPSGLLGSDLRLLITRDDALFIDNDVTPQAGSYNIDNQLITFSNVDFRDGDRFTLGTTNNSRSPLPVELLDFSAELFEASVNLQWSTAVEINNDHFIIERSQDALRWNALGIVNATEIHSDVNNYSFVDYQPKEGINYYRLKQLDKDGKSTFSKIRFVYFDQNITSEGIRIFPNPSAGEFLIENDNNIGQIEIFNHQGIAVNFDSDINLNQAKIRLENQPRGIYFLRVNSKTSKIILN